MAVDAASGKGNSSNGDSNSNQDETDKKRDHKKKAVNQLNKQDIKDYSLAVLEGLTPLLEDIVANEIQNIDFNLD